MQSLQRRKGRRPSPGRVPRRRVGPGRHPRQLSLSGIHVDGAVSASQVLPLCRLSASPVAAGPGPLSIRTTSSEARFSVLGGGGGRWYTIALCRSHVVHSVEAEKRPDNYVKYYRLVRPSLVVAQTREAGAGLI